MERKPKAMKLVEQHVVKVMHLVKVFNIIKNGYFLTILKNFKHYCHISLIIGFIYLFHEIGYVSIIFAVCNIIRNADFNVKVNTNNSLERDKNKFSQATICWVTNPKA